jgi:hypothetical protein
MAVSMGAVFLPRPSRSEVFSLPIFQPEARNMTATSLQCWTAIRAGHLVAVDQRRAAAAPALGTVRCRCPRGGSVRSTSTRAWPPRASSRASTTSPSSSMSVSEAAPTPHRGAPCH